jgi:hypothetical protein
MTELEKAVGWYNLFKEYSLISHDTPKLESYINRSYIMLPHELFIRAIEFTEQMSVDNQLKEKTK